ncbi:hypothetical protein GGI42DRAFT_135069 [Trichoderma sp. SZMC 28013]
MNAEGLLWRLLRGLAIEAVVDVVVVVERRRRCFMKLRGSGRTTKCRSWAAMCLSVCRSGKVLLAGCLTLSLVSSDLVNRRESLIASSTAHGCVKSGADVFQSSPSPYAYSDNGLHNRFISQWALMGPVQVEAGAVAEAYETLRGRGRRWGRGLGGLLAR